MKKTRDRETGKRKLKSLLSSRIKSLQGEMGQFTRNPAFPQNVKTANISLIKHDIASLKKLLSGL